MPLNRFKAAIAKKAPKATRPFTLTFVNVNSDLPVVVHCRHAGYSNPRTTVATLKAGSARQAVFKETEPSTHERVLANLRVDAKVLAHAVESWDNAIDEEGKPYPATPDLVEEMLLALIDELPDEFVGFKYWVENQGNFGEVPLSGAVDLGK